MEKTSDLAIAIEALNQHVTQWAQQNGLGATVLLHKPGDGTPLAFVSTEVGAIRTARVVADALAHMLYRAEGGGRPPPPKLLA